MWRVPKEWPGETCFIVAGGPSVLEQDIGLLKGKKIIVVNSSYRIIPKAQFLFFADARWWNEERKTIYEVFEGRIVTISMQAAGTKPLRLKKLIPPPGISFNNTQLVCQRTSTQGAINLAVHLGVKRIVLLGLDLRAAPDGKTHHHAPHRWPNTEHGWNLQYQQLMHTIEPLKESKIEVINTSKISRIDWWPKMSLEDACKL